MPRNDDTLAVVVLAHHEPQQLARLMQALTHPRVRFYVHVDSASPIELFRTALGRAGVANVVWLPRRRTVWGSIDTVDAELGGIARAVADGCFYVTLISGSDFPLRPVAEVLEFLDANAERSYIEHFPVSESGWRFEGRERIEFYSYRIRGRMYTPLPPGEDTSHLTRLQAAGNRALRAWSALKPARRFPSYLTPVGGSHWFNLSRAAAAFLVEFTERHPDYRAYHRHTVCADEIFVHSVLLGSRFPEDHEVVNDDLRFVLWGDDVNHPETLTMADLPALRGSSDLFARKVLRRHDPQLFAELEKLAGLTPS